MTCYARPLAFLAFIVAAAVIATGLIGELAAFAASAAVCVAGVVVTAWVITSIQRDRASEGRCTTCEQQCQLYMIGMEDRRLPVVFIDEPDVIWPGRPAAGSRIQEGARQ